mmetsp:Transcript_65116/g.160321  ORF Transcript_65116/g.160321 Transcript_65116/m.160321 type:complete len:1255 (+) Transcript_65116:107-3871(+)
MEPLLDEDFKDGKGIVFIGMHGEGDKAKFEVADEAKAFLETLKAPIALASIVGRYRTGKSFLVNRMLLDVVGKGFQVGATVNSCTKGLWMWNKPLRCRNKDGTEVNLLIIDTEGIGSLDADADHDAKIFAMALLLSSYFIYNSTGSIDESALNNLSLVVELTKHIRTKAGSDQGETGENFSQFFPSFLWVVRDFALMLVDESGAEFTSKQYLERSLTPTQGFSEGVEVKNRIRRMLLAFFPDRDCVTLKRPVEDESMLQKLDTVDWGDLRPEFVQQVTTLRNKIYSSAPPKTLNGKALDGHMLAWLAEAYSKSINEGAALNIGDAWAQVSKSKNQKAVTEAISLYEALAEECKKKELPVSTRDLETKHAEFHQKAVKLLRFNSIGDDLEVFTTEVDEKVQKVYAELKTANDTMAREAATAAAEAAYAPVGKMVEEGGFASVHDYDLERKKVKAALVEEVPDTSVKMEVLHCYMEAKLSDAANKIEAKKDLEREKEVTELKEKLSETEHAKEQMRLTLEKETGELKLAVEHGKRQKEDAEERERDARESVERERLAAKARVDEVEDKMRAEIKKMRDRIDEEEETRRQAVKKANLKCEEIETNLQKEIAGIQRERDQAQQRLKDMEQAKEEAEAALAKSKAALKDARESEEETQRALSEERSVSRSSIQSTQGQVQERERAIREREHTWNVEREGFKRELRELRAREEELAAGGKAEAAKLAAEVAKLAEELQAAQERGAKAEEIAERVQKERGGLADAKARLEAEARDLSSELAALKAQAGKATDEQLTAERERGDAYRAKANGLEVSLQQAQSALAELKAELDEARRQAIDERRKGEEAVSQEKMKALNAAEKNAKERSAVEDAHRAAIAKADERATEAVKGIVDFSKDAGEREARVKSAEAKVGELEGKLRERLEEVLSLERAKHQAEERARTAQANHQEASAEVLALKVQIESIEKLGVKTSVADTEPMTAVLYRQARMQDAHNEEVNSLNLHLESRQIELRRCRDIIEKLLRKIEAANQMGARISLDDVPELKGGSNSFVSRMMRASSITPSKGSPLPSEVSALSRNSVTPGGRPKNEIVFKPMQQDVFAQVAKQTNRTTEEVQRAHENARSGGGNGVAAAQIGSGEKFSFSKLRQAITKKVSGAMSKVDEWAETAEVAVLGNAAHSFDNGAHRTPTRNYPDSGVATPETGGSRSRLSGLQWSPEGREDQRDLAGQHRVLPRQGFSSAGRTGGAPPTVAMQSPASHNVGR